MRKVMFVFMLFATLVSLSASSNPVEGDNDSGTAKVSWYGPGFHGRLTASGERFDQNALTAAHKTLPFGTEVKITNPSNGKSVVVTINDRGPYVGSRLFDLSKAAFSEIADTNKGVLTIEYEILD